MAIAELWRALQLDLAAARGRRPDPGGARLVVALVTVLALSAGLTLLVGGYHALFLPLNHAAAGLPPALLQGFTLFGDERIAAALALLFARRRPELLWTLIVAALLATALTRGLKPLVDAARPPAVLAAGAFNLVGPGHRAGSFPSGHSATIATLAGVALLYLRGPGTRSLVVVAMLLVAMSRVWVGVHWPVDVAAGLAIGLFAAWAATVIVARADHGLRPGVHLSAVALCWLAAVSLLPEPGVYTLARPLVWLIGAATALYALADYLWARPAGG